MAQVFIPSKPVDTTTPPLPYTASPWKLLSSDLVLALRFVLYIPLMFNPWESRDGPTDELSFTRGNIFAIAVHVFLLFYQIGFFISLFVLVFFWVPVPIFGVYVLLAYCVNEAICSFTLNRGPQLVFSNLAVSRHNHRHERWVFLNGITVGTHWMQNSVNRLSQIFARPVKGIHTPTSGLIFDLIRCLIQRNFCYATQDVRDAYERIKQTLWDPNCRKLILIAHSQGGIATSLIVDWLVGEVSQEHLQKLEIYTFGNAANHFNDPRRLFPGDDGHTDAPRPSDRGPSAGQFMAPYRASTAVKVATRPRSLSLLHRRGQSVASSTHVPMPAATVRAHLSWRRVPFIEHYANTGDFVCLWGVIHFIGMNNRFLGHLFQRMGTGHLFVQHYLNTMFPLDAQGHVSERNAFMSNIALHPVHIQAARSCRNSDPEWHLSRLWRYRGGRSPLDGLGV